MDLDNALNAHTQWKVRLQAAIDQKQSMDAHSIGRDNGCDLGKWLHSEGKTLFSGTDIYGQVVHRHALFHAAASAVAEKINAREYELAEKMLRGNDFTYASTQVGVAIIQLKKSVGRNLMAHPSHS